MMKQRWNKGVAAPELEYMRLLVALLLLAALPWSVSAAPAVASFSPANGVPGTQVSITGSQFTSVASVRFNDVPADFSVMNAGQIIAIVPPLGTSGKISVIATSGTGVSAANFLVGPRIDYFSPERAATNTTVVIQGANFLGATNVTFNGSNAVFSVVGATQISAKVPAGITNGPISVATSAGRAATTNAFIVSTPFPIIEEYNPVAGAPGTEVLIFGSNFEGATQVKFGAALASFTVPAPTQIRAVVPASAATGPVTVTTPRGSTVTRSTFVVTRAPVIQEFSPAIGTPNSTVVIQGINFKEITGVGFNGRAALGFGTVAENQVSAIVPGNATTGPISVTNRFGSGVSVRHFVITRSPVIEEFSPAFGPPNTQVTFNGKNFTGANQVIFAGNKTAVPSVVADTQLHVRVPSGATSGPVRIRNAFGTNESSMPFLVTGNGPYVIEFAPDSGPRGTMVVITGLNFTPATQVSFNGVKAASVAVVGPNQIQAVAPADVRSGPLQVANAAGSALTAQIFYAPPRLTSVSPGSAVVGTTVTVNGTNFLGASEISLNGAPIPGVTLSSNSFTFQVWTNARSGEFRVVTPGGIVVGPARFVVLPQVLSFSPAIGPVGTPVTILGTGFHEVQRVEFNGANGGVSAPFTNISSVEIRTSVPSGARTGAIRVHTRDGVGTSTNSFLVTGSSDMEIEKTGPSGLLSPGQPFDYLIRVSNVGGGIMSGVKVADTLPAGLQFVSSQATRGTVTVTNQAVTWNLGLFTNGTQASLTLRVQPQAESVFVNTATVSAVEPDLEPTSNTSTATTLVFGNVSRTLRIDRVPGRDAVVLSWPTSSVPFRVQYLNTIFDGALWSDLFGTPTQVGGRNVLTNDSSSEMEFYRLRY